MRGTTLVDLAGGTGDVTFRILEALKASPATIARKFDQAALSSPPSSHRLSSSTRLASISQTRTYTRRARSCD